MQVREQVYIGGDWVAPDATGVIEVISAHSEEVIGQVPDTSPADMDRAVAAARDAFDHGPWPRMTPAERAEGITRLSQAIQARAQEFADTISVANGSPKQWSLMGQVFSATMVLDTYARIATEYQFADDRMGALGSPITVLRQPVGVVAGIIPWNVPLFIAALKLGPAMAAGCPIVIKPAPETALDGYLLAEAVAEGKPKAAATASDRLIDYIEDFARKTLDT